MCGAVSPATLRTTIYLEVALLASGEKPPHQRHWELQDVDQTSLFRSMLEPSATVVDSAQTRALLRNSVGPALHYHEALHVALPSNILTAELN